MTARLSLTNIGKMRLDAMRGWPSSPSVCVCVCVCVCVAYCFVMFSDRQTSRQANPAVVVMIGKVKGGWWWWMHDKGCPEEYPPSLPPSFHPSLSPLFPPLSVHPV